MSVLLVSLLGWKNSKQMRWCSAKERRTSLTYFGPVVDPDGIRGPVHGDELIEDGHDANGRGTQFDLDRQGFAIPFVEHIHCSEAGASAGLVEHKVEDPDAFQHG